MHPVHEPYLITLRNLMPHNFSGQNESAVTQWVSSLLCKSLPLMIKAVWHWVKVVDIQVIGI